MIKTVSELKEEVADREAIRDCVYRYSRAIDRGELDLLRTVYWPDAIDHHPGFEGNVEQFIAWVTPQQQNIQHCMHILGSIFIRISGSIAAVESYFCSILVVSTGSPMRETIVCGRYLDKFERRNDDWRIAGRMVVHDWFRQRADAPDWSVLFGGLDLERGALGSRDKSYTWLGLR